VANRPPGRCSVAAHQLLCGTHVLEAQSDEVTRPDDRLRCTDGRFVQRARHLIYAGGPTGHSHMVGRTGRAENPCLRCPTPRPQWSQMSQLTQHLGADSLDTAHKMIYGVT